MNMPPFPQLIVTILFAATLSLSAANDTATLQLRAIDFPTADTGYYVDQGKWLAINPKQHQSARTALPSPLANGHYHVTLHAVGEEDGRSTYQIRINGTVLGDEFTCPISRQAFEEGPAYTHAWRNIQIDSGDIIEVSSRTASTDDKEYSRGRWSAIHLVPANAATKQANAESTPAQTSERLPVRIQPRQPDGDGTIDLSGEFKQWHAITLTLDGPFATELDNAPNPFTDYNFTVTFTHESGTPSYQVPGYFAADGQASESSATAGTKWRTHLAPDKTGTWHYTTSFTQGPDAALDGGGTAHQPYTGIQGSFSVAETDKSGRDLRAKGRLHYVGKHHLQFAGNQQYFLKAGADAPETLLAYADFDNTLALKANVPLKTWAPHVKDWQAGDPTWQNGKGKGLIGALNYLSSTGANAFSFLTYNAGGDGDNIWPFVHREDKLHWDCSKLDQWAIVFKHATAKGLYLHFKLQENEMDDNRRGGGKVQREQGIPESLDGGELGRERKLYCRELIARFGHNLALNWNIGEENTQSTEEVKAMIDYIRATDPYPNHIVLHTFIPQQDRIYTPLLGKLSGLTGTSLQNQWDATHQRTLKWVTQSAAAGKPWVVANDEQGNASEGVPPDHGYAGFDGKLSNGTPVHSNDDIRKATLWGNLMAGGAGVEYYFGYKLPQNDLLCEDWRSREQSWQYARIALEFFPAYQIPFWEMKNANALIGNFSNDNRRYCLAKHNEIYLVYLPEGGSTELNLTGTNGQFQVQWFNPRRGGDLQQGSITSVSAGRSTTLGRPPSEADKDWLIVVSRAH